MSTLSTGYPIRESVGSMTMHICKFSNILTSDTYASAIPGVVGFWLEVTSGYALAVTNGAWQVSESSGTFTFLSGAWGVPVTGTLYVLSKS